jgi:hypothetical protein
MRLINRLRYYAGRWLFRRSLGKRVRFIRQSPVEEITSTCKAGSRVNRGDLVVMCDDGTVVPFENVRES